MKTSKIPGLGRFGLFIDDLKFEDITEELWMEIGELHLKSLVTIIRDVDFTGKKYEKLIRQWGRPRALKSYRLQKKYGITQLAPLLTQSEINGIPVDEEDRIWFQNLVRYLPTEFGFKTGMLRVSGKRDKDGNPLGMFAEGELLWHSNESANLTFAPGVSLLGGEGMIGSATGFVTTVDWYEEQTESFRSELDDMIVVHKFTPGRINPGLNQEQDEIMRQNMCPEDSELPLVIKSPYGYKGLHYSVNTINSIKGMSNKESQDLFDYINKTLFVDKYVYDHWYKQNNDLCLFDNSITLHRRLGGIAERTAYRIQYDYAHIAPQGWNPYLQDPYKTNYKSQYSDIEQTLFA